jgi:hypothetical protein
MDWGVKQSMNAFTRKIDRVGIYTASFSKSLYLHWPCRNLPTPLEVEQRDQEDIKTLSMNFLVKRKD